MYKEVDINNKRHARIRIWAFAYEGHQPPEPHLISESYFSLFFCSTTRSGGFIVWAGPDTNLLCPWDFPGKNTGVGCLFFSPGDLPDPGIEPVSPLLVGGFFITEPPRKPQTLSVLKLRTPHIPKPRPGPFLCNSIPRPPPSPLPRIRTDPVSPCNHSKPLLTVHSIHPTHIVSLNPQTHLDFLILTLQIKTPGFRGVKKMFWGSHSWELEELTPNRSLALHFNSHS